MTLDARQATVFKDAKLDELATWANVAQFVSFSPDCAPRFCRIVGVRPNATFADPSAALETLIRRSNDGRVNLRSFRPESPQGNEFIYGLDRLADAEAAVRRLAAEGLFVIANETIDVNDGGVSGVAQSGVIEFAPGSTPRVVETDRATTLPLRLGTAILSRVYGLVPDLPDLPHWRVEFSLHPIRCGFMQAHTVIWEGEAIGGHELSVAPNWPNSFSEFVGDKVFGLLIAEALGFLVPRATVICRHVAPFILGQPTTSDVRWLRTCPRIPEPGLFPTVRGWADPFLLMKEDSDQRIAALMIQDEVPPQFSGAMLTGKQGPPIIEGVAGAGDQFMLGRLSPEPLSGDLMKVLQELHASASEACGSVRIEWVFDGKRTWVLQFQQEEALSSGCVVVPGVVNKEIEFDVTAGLEALRELTVRLKGTNSGIKLVGRIGLTSHLADVLRRSNVPSRIVP